MKSIHIFVGLLLLSIAVIINGVLSFYENKIPEINVAPGKTEIYLIQSSRQELPSPPSPQGIIFSAPKQIQSGMFSVPKQIQASRHFPLNPLSPMVMAKRETTWGSNRILLAGFNMNGQGNRITAKPGETISVSSAYAYDCPTCQSGSINQILVGIAGQGAQACIYDGATLGGGIADFQLTAPMKPGTYEVRFRYAQDYGCNAALEKWWNTDGPPAADATVGKIIVK